MSRGREERRAAKVARKAERHAAKADRKRATARASLSLVAAGEPATPGPRGFVACPCPKDRTLHDDCLLCVAYHAGRREEPRCAR